MGSPDSPNNAFLATDSPVNVSPSANSVTYGNRVTITPGESWYYYNPKDANTKAEERAFIAISSHVPSMVGFSQVAGAGGDAESAVSAGADASSARGASDAASSTAGETGVEQEVTGGTKSLSTKEQPENGNAEAVFRKISSRLKRR